MKLRLYKNSKNVGWLGWLETCKGQAKGFIKLNGDIVFQWN